MSKDDWLASSQTSCTTMAKGTPATSQAHTPVQPTSSLLAAIPSVSTGGVSAIGPPPGFLILPEDPIEHQAVLREQIRADGKTLGKASQVLCNNFRHMGEYHSKQMKAIQECQLAGIHKLKAQVIQALSDWRVKFSSASPGHCAIHFSIEQCGGRPENQNLRDGQQGETSRSGLRGEQEGYPQGP